MNTLLLVSAGADRPAAHAQRQCASAGAACRGLCGLVALATLGWLPSTEAATLSGRATIGDRGIADVTVVLGTRLDLDSGGSGDDEVRGEALHAQTTTGVLGEFAIEIPGGTYTAVFWKAGLVPEVHTVSVPGRVRVSFTAAERGHARLRITAPRKPASGGESAGNVVAGVIEHARNHDIKLGGARILIGRDLRLMQGGPGEDVVVGSSLAANVAAASDGSFSAAVPPGQFDIIVWKRDYEPLRREVIAPWPTFIVGLNPASGLLHQTLSLRISGAESSAGGASGSVTGTWDWFANGEVSFHPDGTLTQGDLRGRWTLSGSTLKVAWSHGAFDTLSLSADGRRLEGFGSSDRNATSGYAVWGTRKGAPTAAAATIAGVWEWFVNGDVTFHPNGTLTQGSFGGRWSKNGSVVKITWSHGYYDTLTLSGDGQRLEGFGGRDPNATSGGAVWGKRK